MTGLLAATSLVLAILFLFVLPGLTWAPILAPRIRAGRAERIACVLGSAVVVSSVLMLTLALVHWLNGLVVAVATIVVTLAPLWWRRQRLAAVGRAGDRLPRLRHGGLNAAAAARGRRRRDAVLSGVTLGIAAALVALSHQRIDPDQLPVGTVVWYYQSLSAATVAASGFPATTSEWGQLLPFQTDYAPFTAHSAGFFALAGPAGIQVSLEAYRLATLADVLVLWILLAGRFLPLLVAGATAIALAANPWFASKALAFKPEMFALALTFFSAWLVDRAVTVRSWRFAFVGAAVGGLIYLAHAEVFLIWLCLLAAAVGARVVGRALRGVDLRGFAMHLLRSGFLAGTVVALALAIGVFGNVLVAGQARILGYATVGSRSAGDVDMRALADAAPDGWTLDPDLTWDFNVAAARPSEAGLPPPTRLTEERLLPRPYLEVWSTLDLRAWSGRILAILLASAGIAAWFVLPNRARRGLLYAVVAGTVLLAGAFIVNQLAHTHVPRRMGARRLLPYEILPAAMGVGILLAAAARPLVAPLHVWRRRLGRSLVGLIIVMATAVGTGISAHLSDDVVDDPGLSEVGFDALTSLRASLPQDAIVLANLYTDGAHGSLLGRPSALDGRAVYLEDIPVLVDSLGRLLSARRFFDEPLADDADQILRQYGITDLVIVGPHGKKDDLGGYSVFPTDYAALDDASFLEQTASFAGGRILVYKVLPG